MKSYYSLAPKEIWTQKVTWVLVLIAITLSTMMTTVVGQSIGILDAMRGQQAAYLNGNRYATLHQLTKEQADALSNDSRLSYIGKVIAMGISDIPNSTISLQLREYEGGALTAYQGISQLEKGRLPKNAGEIALPQDVLSLLHFEGDIGDTISLNIHISLLRDTVVPYEYSHDFVLTGILKANYVGYVSGTATGIVGAGSAKILLPEKYQIYSVDLRTTGKRTFQSTIDDLMQIYSIPEYCIQYNDVLLSAIRIDYRANKEAGADSGFSFMLVAGLLIGALVLFAAGLVIYNILKIAVTKRVKEYGTLRAMGAERGKLYTIVSLQLAILCSIGIPVGAILGILSAKGITTAATGLFSPELFMAGSKDEVTALIGENAGGKILPLIISAAISLFFAFVAAMPAARYAAKVSPTMAMSGQVVNIKRRNRKTGRIRSFEAFYARMNMKRNRGRTIITILSLVMSITVFVALQSFSGLLDTSASIQQMHLGDYSITNITAGFSPKAVESLKYTSGVSALSTLKYSLYIPDKTGNIPDIETSFSLQPGETLHIAGIDEQRIYSQIPSLSQQDLQSIKDGRACFIKNPVPMSYGDTRITNTAIKAGETILVNGKPLRVVGELSNPITMENEGFTNGVQIIVYDTVYDQITGKSNYTEIYLTISEDANREMVEQTIQSICEQTGGIYLSYENTDQQLRESYERIRLLAWGLILFVGLIGILNIINTVYTNIHTRVTEIGVQRAIGMSAGSLYKTFLWEGAYYGIIAAVIGSIGGYISTIFVNAAATDTVQLVSIPVLSITEATLFSIVACLMATCIPLKKIAKMNIVESIERVE
ncbi:ABC transporter permease [Anaerocolumna aminovalerica]|uniref:ABC transporter permease n=1 Tax=Anaerocolumna aminovalerica TaxID=1527 RepID=UPI000BE28522|nr:ABC transporter permease [Anaerocolumna aminovalerica]